MCAAGLLCTALHRKGAHAKRAAGAAPLFYFLIYYKPINSFTACVTRRRTASSRAGLMYGATLLEAVGAGPHTTLPREPYFPFSPWKPRQCAFLACDAMVTSFHFPGRPGKETKQRKGAAGQAKNPCRPNAVPLSL